MISQNRTTCFWISTVLTFVFVTGISACAQQKAETPTIFSDALSSPIVTVENNDLGTAVFAENTCGFCMTGNAIVAQTNNNLSAATLSQQTGTTGGGYGIIGSAAGPKGVGVQGVATATTGFAVGTYGVSKSSAGVAGLFDNKAAGNILIGRNNGASKFRVNGAGKVFADGGFQSSGADFAESVAVAGKKANYVPGDVLVIDHSGKKRLTLGQEAYSTRVAGIYSTKPGLLATDHNIGDPAIESEIPLAVVGIVPCKVTAENGAVEVGDLLVSSSLPGYAMKGTERNRMVGAIVGKALEPLASGRGTVQILVTLQ